MPTLYFVENDLLSDDWPGFNTRAEAHAWIKEQCHALALANMTGKQGTEGTRFEGMTLARITYYLYQENKGSIEKRHYASTEPVPSTC